MHSLDYYIDIGNSAIFHTPVSFTHKYPQVEHYQQIIDDQHRIVQLMYKMISNEHSDTEQIDIPAVIAASGFEEQSQPLISQLLKIKYNEYKKQLIKREVYQGGAFLANFNWKIKNVVGCSQFTHKNRIILKLELAICKGHAADEQDIIALELGVSQARELLNKLKQISKQMKTST